MTHLLLFTAGLAALVFGANLLVRGAGKLALSFGISPLVIRHVDCFEAVARLKRVLEEEIWKQPKYAKVSV